MSGGSTAPSIESSTVPWSKVSALACCGDPPSTAAEVLEVCTEAAAAASATCLALAAARGRKGSAFEAPSWLVLFAFLEDAAPFGPEPFGVILVENLAMECTRYMHHCAGGTTSQQNATCDGSRTWAQACPVLLESHSWGAATGLRTRSENAEDQLLAIRLHPARLLNRVSARLLCRSHPRTPLRP